MRRARFPISQERYQRYSGHTLLYACTSYITFSLSCNFSMWHLLSSLSYMSEMALIGLNKSNLLYDIYSFSKFSILFVYVQREAFNSTSVYACMLHIFSICRHKLAKNPISWLIFHKY